MTELSYEDYGTGTPIVLIHGFCGNRDYWKDVVPLLKEDFRIIAVDLRGHGESSCGTNEFEIEDMADDVYKLLKRLDVKDVYLFGHSLGGYITLSFVEQFPEMVKGFSLVHSTALPDSEEAKAGRLKSIETIENEGIKAFIDGLIPKLFADSEHNHIKTAKEIGYRTGINGATGSLKAMRNRGDRNHVLENANVPVLLIAGGKDKLIAPEKTFSVKGKDYIKEVLLPDSGHMGMLEDPQRVAGEIKGFVRH
ncbi:alpha/beta hydrolase [Bacillus sp. CECT 9360]|uniref:alpha/beta fold hydrolase n=1 Tax=Bacillus sp. CECT 9360 TaxID=2845821 RepID=UPI001E331570|nr:alpha/beta hydrolase [Bacillus sp. CECT 9360]CAH0345497.1 AB hydrolase superfamily protein YdjP [Bacillus sp. CECT 9360]